MCSDGPIAFSAGAAMLSIESLGPIISSGGAANIYGWAHCIYFCCCRFNHLGQLFLQDMLPILSGRPIAFTAAADDLLTWAHYFFRRCCRYTRMGPLHLLLLLLIYLLGPIISSDGLANMFG